MDSLFEGMVLFTPSQLTDEQKLQQQQQQQNDHNHDHDHDHSNNESHSNVDASTDTINDTAPSPTSLHKVQEPLDENLFSDLTLQTLTTQLDPVPTSLASTAPSIAAQAPISRQISRKKKKAASLRIGYGREASFDDLSSQSHPPPHPPLPPLPNPHLSADAVNNQNLSLKHDASSVDITQPDKASQSPTSTDLADGDDAELDSSDASIPDSQPLSKDDEFEHVKALISEKLQRSRQLAASVSAASKDAVRRRRKAADDLNLASATHRDLELQLEKACEAEDFEAAERISDSLATVDKERQALHTILKDAEAQCDAIDSKMRDVLESHIVVEQECACLLSNFAKVSTATAARYHIAFTPCMLTNFPNSIYSS